MPGTQFFTLTSTRGLEAMHFAYAAISVDILHYNTREHVRQLPCCWVRCSRFQAGYLYSRWIKRTACCSLIPATVMFMSGSITVLPYHCHPDVDRGRRRAASSSGKLNSSQEEQAKAARQDVVGNKHGLMTSTSGLPATSTQLQGLR